MSSRKVATHTILRQASRGYFKSVWVEEPMLIFVQEGQKFLGTDHQSIYANKNEVAVLSSNQLVNIENSPASESDYIAEVFVFEGSLIEDCYARHFPDAAQKKASRINMFGVDEELNKVFLEVKDAILSGKLPDSIVEHRASELILWLSEHGIYFHINSNPNEVERVRKTLLSDIAHDWKASEVASELGVSEPTLRRHLSKENTSFTEILTDLRLGKALELLQATDMPVTTIAYDIGFGSPSHFTERFKKRFDIPPTAIRKRAS